MVLSHMTTITAVTRRPDGVDDSHGDTDDAHNHMNGEHTHEDENGHGADDNEN